METQKLIKLYNTLLTIETKGENTKIMASCIVYLEQLLTETNEKENQLTNRVNKENKEEE